ncbi:MAG: peptide deformylase [SAR202 cluster bacterium]|nr:peptide deformylase [SAR202 cluster bacterium]
MSILPIYEFPNQILRQKAKKVKRIDRYIERLIGDMIDTMTNAGGVGLAANQVGILRRVIVIRLSETEDAMVFINPEIIHREGERLVEEGCLSVPGYKGMIKRSIWVKAKGIDETWRVVRLRADGLLAQALEHEIDHLNGVLFLDHLKEHEQLIKLGAEDENELIGAAAGHA